MYKFRRATEEERKKLHGGTHKIWGLWGYGISENEDVLFLGRAMTVFGQPDWIDEDWENMYSYFIVAEDEQDNKIYLEVYHGPSGPAIGGKDGENYRQASEELGQLILSAEPADYVWEGCYYDIPDNIKYTVKDGKAYVEHDFPEDMDFENIDDFM